MKIINDGKFQLFQLTLFGYSIGLKYYITGYCSGRASEYSRLIFDIWKAENPIFKKVWYFQYVLKPYPDSLKHLKQEDEK